MTKTITSNFYIDDLFEKAGGAIKIALALNLHQLTVERWRLYGIPVKYWDKLCDLYDLVPAELYVLTKACIARRKRSIAAKMGAQNANR